MANLGSLVFQVGADTSPLRSAEAAVKRSTGAMGQSFLSLGTAVKGVAFAYVANEARKFTSEVVETGMKLQQLSLSFKAITGTADLAAKELGFVKGLANTMGQSFLSVADAYKGIAAAAKGTNLEGKKTQDVFKAIMEASTVLGLSSEQASRSLYALSQMISKGKVSSEELRQQLGENLPGAFNIAAEAMGMTTQEFDKMLSEGKVLTEDFLPKFAQAMHDRYGGSVGDSANSARAATNRLSNAFVELQDAVWKRGESSYTAFIQWLAEVVAGSASAVESLGKSSEEVNRYGTTVKKTTEEGRSWLETFSASLAQQSTQWAAAFDTAASKASELASEILNIPEVKTITIQWFNQVFGGGVTQEEMIVPKGRQRMYESMQRRRSEEEIAAGRMGLSPYQIDPELARLQGARGSGRYGADAREADIKAAAKVFEKYGLTPQQKFSGDTSDMKRALENAGYSQEVIQQVVSSRNAEWSKLQNKRSGKKDKDEVWEYQNKLMEEGRRLTEANFTATEKYNAELEKLNWYLDAGAISQDEYDRAVQATWDDLVKVNEASEGWRGHLKILEEGKILYSDTRTETEKYAAEIEKLNYLMSYGAITQDTYDRGVNRLKNSFKNTTDSMSEFASQAARNIQDAMGDAFYKAITGNFDDIGEAFAEMVAKMVSQAASAQLGKLLFGEYGSSGSSGGGYSEMGGIVGNLFSSYSVGEGGSMWDYLMYSYGGYSSGMAAGGDVNKNTPYLVGEKGPELFVPGSAGSIVPNSDLSGGRSQPSAPPVLNVSVMHSKDLDVEVKQNPTEFDGQAYHANISLKLLKRNIGGYRDAVKGLLMPKG